MTQKITKISLFETNQAFLNHVPEDNEISSVNVDDDSEFKSRILKDAALTGNATTATTPSVSDNSTKIVNTNYINTKFQVLSALPASPTSGVIYIIV